MKLDAATLQAIYKGTLAEHLGIRIVELSEDRVLAEIDYRPDLTTYGGAVHGGTLMAFADTLGATAAVLGLAEGAATTTLESKTNFFAACRGGVVRAETVALHRGRRTSVWQTRLSDGEGRLLSQTVQTQMTLDPR